MYYTHRRFARFLAASIITVGLSAHSAFAVPNKATLQAILQSEYDNMNAAMSHGDLTRYLSYHTADYSETDPQGLHSQFHGREQDRARTRRGIQWIKHFDAENHINFHYHDAVKSLSMTENSIAVTAEERSSIQWPLVESEQDVWVKQGGRWLMKQRRHGTMHAEVGDGVPPNKATTQAAP